LGTNVWSKREEKGDSYWYKQRIQENRSTQEGLTKEITIKEVEEIIEDLRNKKAPGWMKYM